MILSHRFRQTLVACCAVLFTCSIVTTHAAELFVTDRKSNSVMAFDEETGEFLRTVAANDPESEELMFSEPTGLTFGHDGYLYVSNAVSGFPGGAPSVTRVHPVSGDPEPYIVTIGGAGGVAYHEPSNTLFVSEFGNFDGNDVFRYDSNKTLLQTISGSSLGVDEEEEPVLVPAPATGRTGMTFDSAGNLYVSEFNVTGVGSVMKYDYSGPDVDPSDDYAGIFTTFASGADMVLPIGAPAAGFNGLAFDGSGDLFVASLIGQALIKFDVDGGAVVGGGPFGAPLAYPSGVFVGQDGNILVSTLGNDNPTDPFFGPFFFPGDIVRMNSIYTGAAPFLVGDMNHDAVVDENDLEIWQEQYGEAYEFGFPPIVANNGDLDGDFDTDGRDFLLWQRGFGNQGAQGIFQPTGMVRYLPPVEILQTPEPTSAVLAGLALAAGTWFRWRHR